VTILPGGPISSRSTGVEVGEIQLTSHQPGSLPPRVQLYRVHMKRKSNGTTAAGSDQAARIRSERREAYLKKFKDPRWQKMRLEVMSRDEFACQVCFDSDSTLNVHHRYYLPNNDPWEYPLEALVTLCETCHEEETETRPQEERALLRAVREHFFSAEVNTLARTFMFMKPTHIPSVVADAVEWALTTPKIQRELVDRYFTYLMEKRSAKTSSSS
jgi:5-methylcytosine-specific restriction endonuclease McrA